MDNKRIEELIELAKSNGLSELKIKEKNSECTIKFPYASETISVSTPQNVSSNVKETVNIEKNYLEITSPFVGTFYKASSPDTPPYVKVGDSISSGKVLCIVEAMKIMNEIESDISGEIIEICVENENYVEFGQVLFKVKAN